MKMKMISVISSVALLSGLVALASNCPDVAKALAGSTAWDISARAADLVAKAAAADKKDVSIAVVNTAVAMKPAASVAIVSAIVRQDPAAAPAVAVTAATLQPKRIALIAKAAATAAPSQAAKIVAALIKEFPRHYAVIATAAAAGAPSAGREILAAVADSIPGLKASIQVATASYSDLGGNVPVQTILTQSYDQALISGAVDTKQVPAPLAQSTGALAAQSDVELAGVAKGSMTPTPTLLTISPLVPSFSAPTPPSLSPPFTGTNPPPETITPLETTNETPGTRTYSSP